MAKEIRTEILINATPKIIWNILTAFDKYPDWNPFIRSIKGPASVGHKITALLQQPNSKPMTFKPTVLAFDAHKEFRWLGHLIIPGIFDGEHKFELIDHKDGTTTFVQSEKFGGILVPLFKKMLDNTTAQGFTLMNQKLKEMAEKA